jgi:hypothetical protein
MFAVKLQTTFAIVFAAGPPAPGSCPGKDDIIIFEFSLSNYRRHRLTSITSLSSSISSTARTSSRFRAAQKSYNFVVYFCQKIIKPSVDLKTNLFYLIMSVGLRNKHFYSYTSNVANVHTVFLFSVVFIPFPPSH